MANEENPFAEFLPKEEENPFAEFVAPKKKLGEASIPNYLSRRPSVVSGGYIPQGVVAPSEFLGTAALPDVAPLDDKMQPVRDFLKTPETGKIRETRISSGTGSYGDPFTVSSAFDFDEVYKAAPNGAVFKTPDGEIVERKASLTELLAEPFQAGLEKIIGGTSRIAGDIANIPNELREAGTNPNYKQLKEGYPASSLPVDQSVANQVLKAIAPMEFGAPLIEGADALITSGNDRLAKVKAGGAPLRGSLGDMTGEVIDNPEGVVRNYAPDVVASIPAMLGMVTGNPTTALGIASGASGVESYGQDRLEGRGMGESAQNAAVQAALEAVFEKLPIDAVLKPSTNSLAKAGKVIAAETITEGLTGPSQYVATQNTRGEKIDKDKLQDSLVDSLVAGFGMSGPLATAGVAVDKFSSKSNEELKNTITDTFEKAQKGKEVSDSEKADAIAAATVLDERVKTESKKSPPLGEATAETDVSKATAPPAVEPTQDLDALIKAKFTPQGQTDETGRLDQTNTNAETTGRLEANPDAQANRGAAPNTNAQANTEIGASAAANAAADNNLATDTGRERAQNKPANEAVRLAELEAKSDTQDLTPEEANEYVRLNKQARNNPAPIKPASNVPVAPAVEGKRQWKQKMLKGKPVTQPGKNGKPVPVMVPTIDYKKDTLIHWLGAAGGINFDNVGKQIGIDKALFKDKLNRPFGVRNQVLRRNGGMTLDDVYEKMKEDGWLLPDSETGQARDDASAMEDMLMDALAGRPVYHPYEGRATRDSETQDARQEEPSNFATADELAQEEGFENANEKEAFELYVANELDREQDIDADRYEEIYASINKEYQDGLNTQRAGSSESDSARAIGEEAGLFAQASPREEVRAAQERKSAERDGKTGAGRTDMLSGDGELFAGKRPEQNEIPGSENFTQEDLDRVRAKPANDRTEAEVAAANAFLKEQARPEKDRKEKEDAEREAAANDTDGFADKMEPRQRQRAIDALNRTIRVDGEYISRKAHIRRAVADGSRVGESSDGRVLRHKDGSYQLESALSKTGLDYAEYLAKSIDLDGSNYSLSAGSTNGLSNQEVVRVAVRVLGDNPDQGAVPVLVVDSAEQLPQAIRDDMEANDIPAQEVRGVHWRGKSYLVADKLTTEAEVEEVIFHEHYTHGGLRAKYGNRLNDVLAGLVDGVGGLDGLRKLASDQKIDLSLYEETVLGNPRIAQKFQVPYLMEELLAHMSASTGKLRRVIQEYVGAIRAWLRSNKFPGLSEYGVTDLANVLKQAREATLEKAASNSSRPFYQRVFHGTHARGINKFSLDKMGTGEGAQAFGWGMYFASSQEIAEHYRKNVTDSFGGPAKKDTSSFITRQVGLTLGDLLDKNKAEIDRLEQKQEEIDGNPEYFKDDYIRKIKGELAAYKKRRDEINSEIGQTYKVEIPEDSDLMDWDRPLSEQPEKAQPVLRSMWHKAAKSFSQIDKSANPTVGQIHHLYTQHRGGNAKAFADEMNDAGVVGLKYLDSNSRATSGGEIISVAQVDGKWRAKVRVQDRAGVGFNTPADIVTTSMPFETEDQARKWADGQTNGASSNYVIWDEAAIGEPEAMYSRSSDDQAETPAFKAWFGDSKVVDADGKPLVVYRGESLGDNFAVFDKKQTAENSFFFTDDKEVARDYARGKEPRAFYLKADKLLDLTSDSAEANKFIRKWAKDWNDDGWVDRTSGEDVDPVDVVMSGRLFDYEGDWSQSRWRDLQASIQAAGYDGAKLPDSHSGGMPMTAIIVFEPNQIKSATGNSGAFDAGNPDIRYSRKPDEARADAEAKRNDLAQTLPTTRGTAGWNYDASRWEGRKGWLRKQRADLQDKMVSWKYLQEDLNKVIPDAENVYRLETLMHGRVADSMDTLERESIVPLVEAMRRAKVDVTALEQYLYARHAQERNEHIADINPSMPDYGSGMGTDEATKILADAKPVMATLAKQVDKMLADTRRRMLDAGLITQEQFNSLNSQYKHYIPLRGKKTEANDFDADMRRTAGGGGVDTRGSMLKTAMGRGKGNLAENLLAEVIGDAQRSIIMAEKARVGRAVMRVVLANPNPALWEVEPVQTERKLDANGEVYEAVINDWSDPRVIAVKHKGQLYKISIADEQLAKALNHVGVEKLGEFTRIAGKMNRYFSSVLTQYNPAFIPVNATRDAIFGLTALAAEKGEGTALKVAAHYAQAIWAMQRHTRGVKGNNAYDVWADEFAKAGGQTGYVNMPSIEDITDAIGKGRLGGYSPTGIAKAGRVIADAVGTMNTAVENALRLSTYVELRKQGASQEAAAEYAKNLTVNFNKKGFNGSALNSWFLFYNAALQGAVRSSQVMRKPKTWGYLGAMAAAQVAATMFAMGLRDDDDEPIANKIPDHVKRRNLWFVIPGEAGEHTLVTIPLPYGFNVFPYIAGRTTSALMNEEQKPDETAAELTVNSISALIESFMPIPLGKGPIGMLPYPVTIAANVQTNRDDFGRPIRQEDPYAKSDMPRSSIGKPDTMEIFKITAKGLNRLGGGDDETVPAIPFLDLAPEDLEYMSKALTGGAGKFVIDVAATGGNMIDQNAPEIGPDGVPIVKRYVTKVDDQAAQRSMYYDRRSSINNAAKKLSKIYKAEGMEAAQQYLDTTPALIGARFDTRKNEGKGGQPAGSVILTDGKPKLEVGIQDSPFGKYKAAEKALSGIRDEIEAQYNAVPASIIPNEKSRKRDAEIRRLEVQAWGMQYDFNKTWNRDVVDDK